MKKAIVVPLMLLFLAGYSYATKGTVVEGIRYSSYKSHTRIVIDFNGCILEPSAFFPCVILRFMEFWNLFANLV